MSSFKNAFVQIAKDAKSPENIQYLNVLDIERFSKKIAALGGVFLYGCGNVGNQIAFMLNNMILPICGVCDSYRNGTFRLTGQTIMSPEELREKHPEAFVLITTDNENYEREMIDKLKKLGFADTQILPHSKLPKKVIGPATTVESFIDKYYEGYNFAYDQLADDTSRRALIDRVRYYITNQPFAHRYRGPRYFPKGVQGFQSPSHGEVFVDGGAHHGETVRSFIEHAEAAGVSDWKIYSFEPEIRKCDHIKTKFARYGNLEVLPMGLWSTETELTFYLSHTFSQLASFYKKIEHEDIEEITIPVTSLDAFFKDKPQSDWPTFIKMEIRGAEIEALKGAKKIIKTKRPKLALSVYHEIEHSYELLRIAQEYNPDYYFYYGLNRLYAVQTS